MQKGFTLIELVIVILLLGILAAFAVPKWLGKGGFETQTLRDELVARLRLVQSINMQEPANQCTRLALEENRFAHRTQPMPANICPAVGAIDTWSPNTLTRGSLVTASPGTIFILSANSATTFSLRFDAMGRPLEQCTGGCTIGIKQGGEASRLKIEGEGYIHAIL